MIDAPSVAKLKYYCAVHKNVMVNVQKGVLIECDPQMKQFLLHLDESNVLGTKFIIQDLDQTHLFVSADIIEKLKNQIDHLMDQINIFEVQ